MFDLIVAIRSFNFWQAILAAYKYFTTFKNSLINYISKVHQLTLTHSSEVMLPPVTELLGSTKLSDGLMETISRGTPSSRATIAATFVFNPWPISIPWKITFYAKLLFFILLVLTITAWKLLNPISTWLKFSDNCYNSLMFVSGLWIFLQINLNPITLHSNPTKYLVNSYLQWQLKWSHLLRKRLCGNTLGVESSWCRTCKEL